MEIRFDRSDKIETYAKKEEITKLKQILDYIRFLFRRFRLLQN